MALLRSVGRYAVAAALAAALLGAWGASAQVASYLSEADMKRFEAVGKGE